MTELYLFGIVLFLGFIVKEYKDQIIDFITKKLEEN